MSIYMEPPCSLDMLFRRGLVSASFICITPGTVPGELPWVRLHSTAFLTFLSLRFPRQVGILTSRTAFQCLPALLSLAMCFVLPESPRWLLMKDRYEEAKQTLLKIHSPEEAAVELTQINRQMMIDRQLPNSYWIMFKKPSYRKRSLLALGTTCTIQFSGILVINSTSPV